MTQITISRGRFGKPFTDTIEAEVFGCFAVHPDVLEPDEGEDITYVVTHVPTGYACLTGLTRDNALKAAEDFLNSGLDWSTLTDPNAVTDKHKRIGKRIRQQYGDRG